MKKKDSSTGKATPKKPKNQRSQANANDTYVIQQRKLRASIKDIITRGKERGFYFYTQEPTKKLHVRVGASERDVPKAVKNPGPATISRLQKIKDNLYKYALWIDPEYSTDHPDYQPGTENYEHPAHSKGIFSGLEGREIERSRAAKKGAQTRATNKKKIEQTKRPPNAVQPPPKQQPYWADIASVRASLTLLANHTESWPAMEEAKRRAGRGMLRLLDDKLAQHKKDNTLFEYSVHLQNNADIISKAIDAILPDSNFTHVENQCSAVRKMINEGELTQQESEYYGGDYDNPYDDTEAEE